MSESNVRRLTGRGESAEDMLRDALSDCSEVRSRGGTPHVFILVAEDPSEARLPGFYRTGMSVSDLLACAATVNVIANRELEMTMVVDDDGVREV